ncbi:phage shock protein PspC (stress-responsive transcriptional regulator) [Okibacterium sp. HSC-33S16]|uniref:SCO7613 C-terminal domain-containing membrane protein n=1 Tax=Okibacterium sp. HSC-33S16 TaxID=2910965 RepID=UPI00209D7A84|nr:hypothetical protein [Okibacterium sp. HSC-33S16]MCP2030634.1 phage shock protein PspC (stress-responsive transcriptional regulator) [Okibacterium sp. HSC-33S16]
MSLTPGSPPPSARPAVTPNDAVRWPLRADFLTDSTRCPSCFAPLSAASFRNAPGITGPVCTQCGLDLSGAEATEVFETGKTIVAAESRRQQLMGQMRAQQAERAAHAQAAWAAPQVPVPQAPSVPIPQPPGMSHPLPQAAPLSAWYPQATGTPPPVIGSVPPDPGRPRRSGIQILMLTVGVILVSIMATFFVLLAYLIASLEVRSVLTAVASLAVFGASWLLYRRTLLGTAEGVAVLAIVLLVLDVWIIRANDLFGSGNIDGWLYTGIATGVLAILLAIAFRGLPLRSISLSSVVLAPFAVLAVTVGILTDTEGSVPAWGALSAVGIVSLAWKRLPFGALERQLFRAFGFVATALAIVPASFTFIGWDVGPVIGLTLVACIWFAHLVVSPFTLSRSREASAEPTSEPLTRETHSTAMQVLAAVGLGLAVATMAPALWLRIPDLTDALWMPAVIALTGAILLALIARVPAVSDRATLLMVATTIPIAVAALAIIPAVVIALSGFDGALRVQPFDLTIIDEITGPAIRTRWTAALALLGFSVLTLLLLAALDRARRFGWVPLIAVSLGLIAASFAIATPALTALGFLSLAISGLLCAGARRLHRPYRILGAATSALSTLALFLVGMTNTVTFPFTALAVLALLISFREIVDRSTRPRFALWTTPFIVAALVASLLLSVRLVPEWVQTVTGGTAAQAGPVLLVALCALAILCAVPLTTFVTRRSEAAVTASVAVVPVLIGVTELATRVPVDAGPFLTVCALTAGVAILWQFPRTVATWPERFVGAAAAPVLAVVAAGVGWDQLGQPGTTVVASALTVILAAVGLVLFRAEHPAPHAPEAAAQRIVHPAKIARLAWDASIALTIVPISVQAARATELGWAALLLLAVTVILIASGEGGPIQGRTARHHVAWAGLPLAVAALWVALTRNDVTVIELYTLPVAGLLLAVLAVVLVRRHPVTTGSGRSALLSAALAVAVIPSAVASSAEEPLRGGLVVSAAAVLLVIAPFLPSVVRGTRLDAVVYVAGAGAALTTVVVLMARGTPDGWHNEGVAAALLVAGLLWLFRAKDPRALGTAAVALSSVVVAVPLAVALLVDNIALWRLTIAVVFCLVLYVVGSSQRLRSSLIRWTALGSALLLAVAGVTSGVADPFEWVTVPLAAGLLTAGALRLAADPIARSWPHLGVGVLLLLVPSLLADFTGTELWRVVALGLVSLAVFGAGLALKLSAPAVTGAAVIIVHALAQLWPWISDLYGVVPWWLWAGIGGVILIVLAATYEKRIRDLRAVARSISSLR